MVFKEVEFISHWDHLAPGLQTSPSAFYNTLKETIAKHETPGVKTEFNEYNEAGLFSAKRKYLRVCRDGFVFDICGAPFGKDFFFSWWYAEKLYNPLLAIAFIVGICLFLALKVKLIAAGIGFLAIFFLIGLLAPRVKSSFIQSFLTIPILGWLWYLIFIRGTYYQMDTHIMYCKVIHNAVLESINIILEEEEMPLLKPEQSKPILSEFYSRKAK